MTPEVTMYEGLVMLRLDLEPVELLTTAEARETAHNLLRACAESDAMARSGPCESSPKCSKYSGHGGLHG